MRRSSTVEVAGERGYLSRPRTTRRKAYLFVNLIRCTTWATRSSVARVTTATAPMWPGQAQACAPSGLDLTPWPAPGRPCGRPARPDRAPDRRSWKRGRGRYELKWVVARSERSWRVRLGRNGTAGRSGGVVAAGEGRTNRARRSDARPAADVCLLSALEHSIHVLQPIC